LNARAIAAPARLVAGVRENRVSANFGLRLVVKNFLFATFDISRVIEGDCFEGVGGFGISHSVFKPQEIGRVHKDGACN
jgi:hypothetical protein